MQDVDAVVIGSGAGGLAAALALAQAGQSVVVLEQHDVPGGWCHSFTLGGHRFSPGVHYIGELGPGGRMRAIYEGLGLGGDLTFCELNPDGFDHLRIGGERYDVPKGRENQIRRLQERFPRERAGLRRYFDRVTRISSDVDHLLDVHSVRDVLGLPGRVANVLRWGLGSLQDIFDATVQDPLLRAVLAAQSGDHGLPPELAPGAVHAGITTHYFDGGWYPRGGAFTIPRAFVRALKKAGGALRLQTPVERILLEKGRAIGVRLRGGEELRARTVISNADPHATFAKLLQPGDLPGAVRRRLARTRYSTSALSLFFATDLDLRAHGLDSGNVWSFAGTDVSGDYRKGLTAWDLEDPAPLPGLFLTCTTLKDPSKQVNGQHTLEAFTFVHGDAFRRWAGTECGARPGDYAAVKEKLTAKLLAGIGRIVPALPERVTFRALATPLTNVHYVAATGGNLYGTEKSRWQVGPWAWPVKSEVPGLYLCGASTVSHGVMGATLSGLFAAKAILGTSVAELLRQRGPSIECVPSEHPETWPAHLQPRPERPAAPAHAEVAAPAVPAGAPAEARA